MSEGLADTIADELFFMVNVRGRSSGLPMNIWIGPRGGAKHDAEGIPPSPRIKVQMNHREQFDTEALAVVSVEDIPEVKEGRLAGNDLDLVRRYIAINRQAILDHWYEKTDGIELGRALKTLNADIEEILADMVSARGNMTGVDNTIFISVNIPGRAPHIRIAVEPPTHLDPFGKCAVVSVGDGSVVEGTLPARVRDQARDFVALNWQALLDYWHCRIATAELLQRLRAIRT
jgi:hypothetical protein